MTMTASQLVKIAEAAFGRQWKPPPRAARKAQGEDCTTETLRRYSKASGEESASRIPPEVALKIAKICRKEIQRHIERVPVTLKAALQTADGILTKLQAAA